MKKTPQLNPVSTKILPDKPVASKTRAQTILRNPTGETHLSVSSMNGKMVNGVYVGLYFLLKKLVSRSGRAKIYS